MNLGPQLSIFGPASSRGCAVIISFLLTLVSAQSNWASTLPPKVGFAQPAQAERFVSPTEILILIEAADADGIVETVEVFWEQGILGKATFDSATATSGGPFRLLWLNPPAGDHKLVAQATDNDGLTAFSESLVVSVQRETLPAFASLEILRPPNRAVFALSDPVTIEVSAVDPTGDIRQVEFFANGKPIGRSDHLTKEAVIPGRPIQHSLIWQPIVEGFYQISARAMDTVGNPVESRTITVLVGDQFPVVSISATTLETREPAPNIRVQPGVFTLRRTGNTSSSLPVSIEYQGSATPAVDYQPLDSLITFPAGVGEVQLLVQAMEDTAIEGLETVAAVLVDGPLDHVPTYMIDPDSSAAKILIHDSNVPPMPAGLEITAPTLGQAFKPGEPITIAVTAADPNGYVARVEFFDFEVQIGVSQLMFFRAPDAGTPIYHTFEWQNATVGEHVLTARALDSNGNALWAKAVFIKVTPEAGLPVVQVTALDAEGTEFPPFTDTMDPVRFAFSRDGDLGQELYVAFSLHGTAEPDQDYKRPDRLVRIPPGEREAILEVVPLSDDLDESMETVAIRLEDPMPISSIPVPPTLYRMPSYGREAVAVLYDRQRPGDGVLELALPGQGETLDLSQPISLIAAAFHPTADLSYVDFYADDQLIGSSDLLFSKPQLGGLIVHRLEWHKPISGGHVLTARTRLPDGTQLVSTKTTVTVRGEEVVVEPVPANGGKQVGLPEIKRIERQRDGKLRLHLAGAVNQMCKLEVSSDLAHWSELTDVLLPDGEIAYEDDTSKGQKRFYRTRLP